MSENPHVLTTDDIETILEGFRKERQWSIKKWTMWADLILKTAALIALAWSGLKLTGITEVPARLDTLEKRVEAGFKSAGANAAPEVLEFSSATGVAYPEVAAPGETVFVSYLMRRTINCSTDVRVQFYDHARTILASEHSYTVEAVRSRISTEFDVVTVPVRIPPTLPEGVYSYAPRLTYKNCGIYKPEQVAFSTTFTVRVDRDEP